MNPRVSLPRRFVALCVLLSCFACGGAEEPAQAPRVPGAPLTYERVALSLLEREDLRTVVHSSPDHPVRAELLRPRAGGGGDYAELPALEMVPPCEVRYELAELGRGARLLLATGIVEDGYTGGEVEFEVELGGRVVYSTVHDATPEAAQIDRRWRRAAVSLDAGGPLVLRTRVRGKASESPRAAVAILEIVTPRQVPRRRATPEHPNLVLVVIDTLRRDALSIYAPERRRDSPNLARLAEAGTVFEQAYVPAPWTVPSTASILTGLSPADHGLGFGDSNYLTSEVITLAEVAVEAGLVTAAFSCNPLIARSRNFAQGFLEFHDSPGWPQGEAIVEGVERWLEKHRDERFFLYLHVVDPHAPYEPAPDLRRRYQSRRPEGYPETSVEKFMLRFWKDPTAFSPEFLARVAAFNRVLYQGEVASIDRTLGRLFTRLRALGLLDRTVIAVTSDHGEEFHDHGLMGHVFQLHRELTRVPLVIAGPGVAQGRRVSERVEVRHLAGTLLRLARLDPGPLAAPNLLVSEERLAAAREPFFFTTLHGRYREGDSWRPARGLHGVLVGDWLLFWSPIREARGHPCTFLFDLSRDPAERKNVATEHPQVVERLKQGIARWLKNGQRFDVRAAIGGSADLELMKGLGYLGGTEDG